MPEVKIRLACTCRGHLDAPEQYRITPYDGIKLYATEEQVERWARVTAEFDAVQKEIRDALEEEYAL